MGSTRRTAIRFGIGVEHHVALIAEAPVGSILANAETRDRLVEWTEQLNNEYASSE
jgi:hypothetical protein